jgi:hypothetical protein
MSLERNNETQRPIAKPNSIWRYIVQGSDYGRFYKVTQAFHPDEQIAVSIYKDPAATALSWMGPVEEFLKCFQFVGELFQIDPETLPIIA